MRFSCIVISASLANAASVEKPKWYPGMHLKSIWDNFAGGISNLMKESGEFKPVRPLGEQDLDDDNEEKENSEDDPVPSYFKNPLLKEIEKRAEEFKIRRAEQDRRNAVFEKAFITAISEN